MRPPPGRPTLPCRPQHGTSYRRLTMRGSNGRMYPFIVQHSSSRHARAEERMVQLFRMLNECVRFGAHVHCRCAGRAVARAHG